MLLKKTLTLLILSVFFSHISADILDCKDNSIINIYEDCGFNNITNSFSSSSTEGVVVESSFIALDSNPKKQDDTFYDFNVILNKIKYYLLSAPDNPFDNNDPVFLSDIITFQVNEIEYIKNLMLIGVTFVSIILLILSLFMKIRGLFRIIQGTNIEKYYFTKSFVYIFTFSILIIFNYYCLFIFPF